MTVPELALKLSYIAGKGINKWDVLVLREVESLLTDVLAGVRRDVYQDAIDVSDCILAAKRIRLRSREVCGGG